MDPFTKFLTLFFESALSPELPLWESIKSALSSSPQEFAQLHTFLIQVLIQDYNCRLLLKTAQIDLHKEPSKFPSIFVEHYNVNETLGWCWKQSVIKRWPALLQVEAPQLQINQALAEELSSKLSSILEVQRVITKQKWRVAAFQLNPKEVLEKSVRYLLKPNNRRNLPNSGTLMYNDFKVEIALRKLDEIYTDVDVDSNILLAQCIYRLCTFTSSSTPVKEQEGTQSKHFLEIPKHIAISTPESVIVSFESKREQIVTEINSKEFYSQYSETVVILYNYARIKTILERYDGLVEEQQYPDLPPIDDVDFPLIGESKDEFPIIFILLMWPRVRQYIINLHRRGKGCDKINLPFLFDFVKSLARAFDSFYNRNVIIVPQSAPHNFKTMFCRLYLIKAILVVFKEFIYLSGIEMD